MHSFQEIRTDPEELFPLVDASFRSMRTLRVSVTEACNLRCRYCLPEGTLAPYAPHRDTLTDDEIIAVVAALAPIGIRKVRVTGGEPLLRKGLPDLIRRILRIPGVEEAALTTNALLLDRHAGDLRAAGLRRINISLDTLDPERFLAMTRRSGLPQVLEGIEAAEKTGFDPLKVNAVIVKGVNDADIAPLAGKTLTRRWQMRFIELMPIGQARRLWSEGFVPMDEMMDRIQSVHGNLEPVESAPADIARLFRLPGAVGTIGFITPMSNHFCGSCDRLRLTANGTLRPCLCDAAEIDIREHLRSGKNTNEIQREIQRAAREAAGVKPYSGIEKSVRSGSRTMAQIGG